MDSIIMNKVLLSNYEGHLGIVDWMNKSVLDIGADTGTSAEFFLEKGAKVVVAVEGYDSEYKQLEKNEKLFPPGKLILNELFLIRCPDDLTYLITKWDWVDIVKIDIEGAEIHLVYVPDDIFSIPREYVIDFHSRTNERLLRNKLLLNGYSFYNENKCNVIYARNNNSKVIERI